jgi:hypothetical protein
MIVALYEVGRRKTMNKMTTKATLLAIAFIVSIPLGLTAQDDGYYANSFARLSFVNGSVYVQRTGDLGYEKGEVNLALVQGDKLGTESGQAEIHFGRRNYLRLADNTKVEFAILPTEGNELIKIHLTEGSAFVRVSQLALEKGIEVHTPDASFYVLEEGLYRFDVALDRETRVYVREGSLEAAAEDGSVMVRNGEAVTAADGRLLGDPEYANSAEDAFDEWNGSRDAQLSARSERQYLPSEMEEYEEELDQNGQWVYERPYGNVWVPNVSNYDDWRPYYYGRWVWYPVIGWTWVSSESWGWSVYHYGRWHWRFGLGWYWIPRNHWGPAWVHWWHDRDYIGWCPLTWYNRPAYFLDNRFYDRYDDRFFSAHNRAMTVVRRDHLQARDIGRRHVGKSDLDRIDRVSLRAEQPTIRPAIDRSGPEARAAQRALSVRPGSRSEVRSVAPSHSLSPSRLRQATDGPAVRGGRGNASPDEGRGAVTRPAVRERESGERSIRAYPSQRVSGSRGDNGASDRRSSVASPARRNGSEGGSDAARVSRSQDRTSAAPKPTVERDASKSRATEKRTEGTVPRKTETIKNDRTAARSESSSGRAQSRTYTSRSGVSRPSSRLSAPTASARSGAPSYSRPSSPSSSSSRARSSYSSPSRTTGSSGRSYSAPRSSGSSSSGSTSAPRSSSSSGRSYTAPRSSGSSGRSYSAPRSSGTSSGRSYSAPRSSSSSGRSYAAPRSSGSSGRSYSAPRSSSSSSGRSVSSSRSSGSSSGRSSSSSRSGSSSSRSSGSSSKSGSAKRKG